LTVRVPVNWKFLIVMPPAAFGAGASVVGEAADEEEEVEGVVDVPVESDEDPQEVRRMVKAAPAASAYGFITLITGGGPAWFSVIRNTSPGRLKERAASKGVVTVRAQTARAI
jgi:hypothetical protein